MATQVAEQLYYEREARERGCHCIAGVDEAGRGPLAGPVVAAAVVFPFQWIDHGPAPEWEKITDSKQLTPEQREAFFEWLTQCSELRYGIATIEADIIDQLNILQATHRAMRLALAELAQPADHVLVDGRPVNGFACDQTAIVKGDRKSYSIAAASILAKVTRDRLMIAYHETYPIYGFASHKGYGTKYHLSALAEHGPCPIHRRSFAPVQAQQQPLF